MSKFLGFCLLSALFAVAGCSVNSPSGQTNRPENVAATNGDRSENVAVGNSVNRSSSEPRDKDEGIVYGKGFAFSFKAPKSWVMDTESGKSLGVGIVSYPGDQTWKDSPVMIYGRAYEKDKVDTAQKLVESNVKGFQENGSPQAKAVKVKEIKIDDKRTAQIYHYTGDQWGNFEAAAYIEEENFINYFVLNARNKQIFDESLLLFEELVKTYRLIKDEPGTEKNDAGKTVN